MLSDSGEFQYTSEDVRLMLAFYQEMLNKKVTKPAWDFDRNDLEKCLTAGVASWISDAEYYCEPAQKFGFDIVIGDYPKHKQAVSSGWYKKPISVYAIKKNTKSPEEAAKLLDYLVNVRKWLSCRAWERACLHQRRHWKPLKRGICLTG